VSPPGRVEGLWSAEREGGLVRAVAHGRQRQPPGLLAGPQRGFDPRRFRAHESEPGDEDLRARTFAVVDAAFQQRRKMLRQSLSGLFGDSATASAALEEAGIEPTERGEQLTVDDFIAIARTA
jgi:Dimethyladenosine transferase (rRNA methylation)